MPLGTFKPSLTLTTPSARRSRSRVEVTGVDGGTPGADENHAQLLGHGHGAGAGNAGVDLDVETFG